MNAQLPDNALNAELKTRLDNLNVNGVVFPFFVGRVGATNPKNYFLVTTQLNDVEETKCGKGWRNSTEIQVIVRQPINLGSKELLNQATEAARQALEDLTIFGYAINRQEFYIFNELIEERESEIIYQKIIKLETELF